MVCWTWKDEIGTTQQKQHNPTHKYAILERYSYQTRNQIHTYIHTHIHAPLSSTQHQIKSYRITSAHDSLKTISTTNATQSQSQAPIQILFKTNLYKKRSQAKPCMSTCTLFHSVSMILPCHAMLCHLWMVCFHDRDCDSYGRVVSCHVMWCHADVMIWYASILFVCLCAISK